MLECEDVLGGGRDDDVRVVRRDERLSPGFDVLEGFDRELLDELVVEIVLGLVEQERIGPIWRMASLRTAAGGRASLVGQLPTMTIFTFHLAELRPTTTAGALWKAPAVPSTPGLRYAECLALMRLGASTVSPARMQLRRMAMFARWEDEAAVETFLANHPLGRELAAGWHVRMQFLRRWSRLAALPDLPARAGEWGPAEPVVAVTLARMRLLEVPRFLKWGKPVERLVRDHPGTTLALAAMRPPRTISTFSVWRSVREMEEMVHGHSSVPDPDRHAAAMAERRRRDFHHEFATLRFRPLSEHGSWQGRSGIVPR